MSTVVVIVVGVLLVVGGAARIMTARWDEELHALGGLLVAFTGFMILASLAFGNDNPPCEEYGHVLVVIDGAEHCVPWERASEMMEVVGE